MGNVSLMSEKTDVWSFGVVIYEVFSFCQQVPYEGMKNHEIFAWLQQGNRLAKPFACPDPMYDLMKLCMQWNPEQRPSFKEITYEISQQRFKNDKADVLIKKDGMVFKGYGPLDVKTADDKRATTTSTAYTSAADLGPQYCNDVKFGGSTGLYEDEQKRGLIADMRKREHKHDDDDDIYP
eukprot:TRINITY_DN9441_c0_g1_i1.p1 TRINITY_DN9441_c0_g1~~TRINITY_DN9441_c0_g1_i1.p1  ORF type:complete len:180 (+),score=37.11 TRINITY_DN9441_c0_g1_i1:132-671(+)